MKEKLLLIDVREGDRKRGTQVNIYADTQEMLQDLSARTGQTMAMLANRLIKFAYGCVEIDTENEQG